MITKKQIDKIEQQARRKGQHIRLRYVEEPGNIQGVSTFRVEVSKDGGRTWSPIDRDSKSELNIPEER